jgi:hypothetical protein
MVSFALGVVASLVAWMLVVASFVPRLRISQLNRRTDATVSTGARIRVKVQNRSRLFAVGDLSIHARLVVRGLDPKHPRNYTSIAVPVGSGEFFPVLEARRPRRAHSDVERTYTLHIEKLQGDGLRRLPAELRQKCADGVVTIDDLLGCGSDSYVRLAVTCSHGLSGLRRVFSRRFRRADIATGTFRPGQVRVVSRDDIVPRW